MNRIVKVSGLYLFAAIFLLMSQDVIAQSKCAVGFWMECNVRDATKGIRQQMFISVQGANAIYNNSFGCIPQECSNSSTKSAIQQCLNSFCNKNALNFCSGVCDAFAMGAGYTPTNKGPICIFPSGSSQKTQPNVRIKKSSRS